MTGEAEGKLNLRGAKVFLTSRSIKIKLDAKVYIHLKGYALAKVTHLDIEHEALNRLIPSKRGFFLSIHGTGKGIRIMLKEEKEIKIKGRNLRISYLEVLHPYLSKILKKGEKTRTWVGGKFGGIYIGFRKEQIKRMEEIAKEKFGMTPI